MKLIWQIIRKDIVRERWALLLWALLFVGQVGVGLKLLGDSGHNQGWIGKGQVVNGLLVMLQILLGYFLVARWVHADPLLGTDMFWVTRPITRGRLLAAKALGVVLVFGLLPVALLAPWWLGCGFTLRDVFWAGVDTFGWQLLMIAPAFLIASLTYELGRVLLWTILLFVFLMIWAVVLGNVFKIGKTALDPTNQFVGVVYSRLWLSSVTFVLGCGAVAAHQYLTQRLHRSIWLTVAGLGVVVLVGLSTQDNWTRGLARLPLKAPSPEVATALAGFKVEMGRGLPNNRDKPRAGQEPSLLTEIYFQGLPGEMAVATGTARQTWRWADGQRIRRMGFIGGNWLQGDKLLRRTYGLAAPAEDPETVAWRKTRRDEIQQQIAVNRAKRGEPPPKDFARVTPARPEPMNYVYSSAPLALAKKSLTDPPAYAAEINCVITQPVVVTELPLQVGAQGGSDSTRVRLIELREQASKAPVPPDGEGNLQATVLFTAPLHRTSGLWQVFLVSSEIRNPMRGEVWTVNRATGDLVRVESYALQGVRGAMIAGVAINWNHMTLRSGQVVRNGKWVERDPQWREHCSLVAVAEDMVDYVTTTAKADRLEFLPSIWIEKDQVQVGIRDSSD